MNIFKPLIDRLKCILGLHDYSKAIYHESDYQWLNWYDIYDKRIYCERCNKRSKYRAEIFMRRSTNSHRY